MDAYVYRNGARLTPAMAYDFDAMNVEFHDRTGEWLIVSDGVRMDADQESIFRKRYTPASQLNGRRVYDNDYKWWIGVLWGRTSPDGPVAVPGTSNHQINLSAGRKGALDLRDTGSDPGILARGSFRARVFDEIAGKYGYDSEGYGFGENWHKRYNRDPWRAVPSSESPAPVEEPKREDDDMKPIIISSGAGDSFGLGDQLVSITSPADTKDAMDMGVPRQMVPTGIHVALLQDAERRKAEALPLIVNVRDGDGTQYLLDGTRLTAMADPSTRDSLISRGAQTITLSQAEVANIRSQG